jgi:hypothetical protein
VITVASAVECGMAFPFYPAGAITATLVLGGTLVVFRLLLLALDRGAAELRGSISPGLVRGVRAWAEERERPDPPASTTPPHRVTAPPYGNLPAGAVLEDLVAPPDIAVEAVRGRGS